MVSTSQKKVLHNTYLHGPLNTSSVNTETMNNSYSGTNGHIYVNFSNNEPHLGDQKKIQRATHYLEVATISLRAVPGNLSRPKVSLG